MANAQIDQHTSLGGALLPPLLIAALSLGWGLSWPMMKVALSEFPIWTFRAWSCLVAGSCLLALARFLGHRITPPASEWRGLMLAALCNVTAWHVLVGYGVVLVASGHAAVLAYTMPLWVVLFGSIFYRQPLDVQSIAGLGFGLAAILTLVSQDFATLGNAPVGALLIVIGAAAWGLGTLIQKHRKTVLPILSVSGWQLVLGCVPIFIVMPFVDGFQIPDVSLQTWAAGAYLTFVAVVICYCLWFKIVSIMPVNRASISSFIVPAVGVASGSIVLGEPFGWREVLAMACGATALLLVLTAPKAR